MKYQKLVDELDKLLSSGGCEYEKHQRQLKYFFEQFESEEKKLLKKLKKENINTNRKKLKRELAIVQKAYTIISTA